MSVRRREPVLIGWTEMVDLPEWGVKNLRAKIDTGARTSALHVQNIEELPRDHVRFDVVLHRKKRDRVIHVKTKISRRARVRSSSGHSSMRIFVETVLRLGPVEKRVEVSLVDRERMIHRMLLGRGALSGPFLIDVDRRFVATAKPVRKARAKAKAKSKKTSASKTAARPGLGEKTTKRAIG